MTDTLSSAPYTKLRAPDTKLLISWLLPCSLSHRAQANILKCETGKETQMYRTVFWTLGEGEGGMIWENGIETCIISYMK